MYLKFHSQGEYVFDHHWADAYERAGGRYFPKLLIAAPFTPVNGPRFLAATPENALALKGAAREVAGQLGVSSLHVNFPDEDCSEPAAEYLVREGTQYHWLNRNYQSFDDFLSTLLLENEKPSGANAVRR